MPKVSIYVPDALEKRAKAVGLGASGTGLSVSVICQNAITNEVERRESEHRLVGLDLGPVVSRLRQSKGEHFSAQYRTGHEIGEAWAREDAPYQELRRLADRTSRAWHEIDGEVVCPSLSGTVFSFSDREADPEAFYVMEASDPFWQGVVEGAMAIYHAVESLI